MLVLRCRSVNGASRGATPGRAIRDPGDGRGAYWLALISAVAIGTVSDSVDEMTMIMWSPMWKTVIPPVDALPLETSTPSIVDFVNVVVMLDPIPPSAAW
jgi:hypothetical protein